MYDVLVRGSFHSVALAGDMRQTFLQVRIREGERDALRFHWLRDLHSTEVQIFRFTMALFGLVPSPFLLVGVIEQHLKSWSEKLPHSVAEILRRIYVDDLISGGPTITKTKELKSDAVTIFSDAGFELHKWHSNVPELEENPHDCVNGSKDTYAKQQLSANISGEGSKLLGLKWKKVADTLTITFPQESGILGKLAHIYDPLGLASPTMLQGKFIYREACELKQARDAPLPDALAVGWKRWESDLPENIVVTRTFSPYREPINAVELHAFGDASGRGVTAAVYAVVRQDWNYTRAGGCKSAPCKKAIDHTKT